MQIMENPFIQTTMQIIYYLIECNNCHNKYKKWHSIQFVFMTFHDQIGSFLKDWKNI